MATLILRETYRTLEEEMKKIDRMKRETSARIKEAADHGDLKENAEYHAAREEQSLIVYKKQLMQSHAPFRFVELDEIDTDEVGFGNKVSVLEEGRDKPEIYYLLGLEEEAKKYAKLLGYNYQSSEWYAKSYSVFYKKYKDNKYKSDQQNKSKKT